MRRIVDDERCADDLRIAVEAPYPQRVAEHHRLWAVPGTLFGGERPAKQRLHAEHVEEVARDGHAGQPFWFASPAEEVVADAVKREVSGNRRHGLARFPQVQHVANLCRLARQSGRIAVGNPHQFERLLERQWPQKQGVDDAEDRGAGADAQARDDDGERGKPGIAAQSPKGVAHVLDEIREDHIAS
jgi:hypothetical protein